MKWWHALRRRREAAALARRAIPEALWQRTLASYPFLQLPDADDAAQLRRLASLFLDRKEFHGARGFVVSDEVAVAVAAQACLPVLRFGLAPYDSFVGIVMHADEVVAERRMMDEDGVVHEYDEVLAGEAMVDGPVMLSWQDVRRGSADALPTHDDLDHGRDADADADADAGAGGVYNVVIHEFAHVLDMGDGAADGVPPLPSTAARKAWLEVLMPEWDRFCERVACGYETLLDPYGAEAPEEFFAVAAEAFFVASRALKEEQPALYRLFASYFQQDPAAR